MRITFSQKQLQGVHKVMGLQSMSIEALGRAEMKSRTICEECGKQGELRQDNWFRTKCDGCNLLLLARMI